MSLRKTASLAISIFLVTLVTGVAIAKISTKDSKPQTKKWAIIDGFRSAKFGMDKKRLRGPLPRILKSPPVKLS